MRALLPALALLLAIAKPAFTQQNDIATKEWKASWIAVPDEEPTAYGVYLFRKKIELSSKPSSFIVHVSADNRYKLFINEKLVSLGPARGDITHWNYETVDIAPYLQSGQNIIAAQVWNEGQLRPEAQISLQTGFIMQGDGDNEDQINTNESWKCIKDDGYKPLLVSFPQPVYYVAGPGEQINMQQQIKDWNRLTMDDAGWKSARALQNGIPKKLIGGYGTISTWMLTPSILPQMELREQRLVKLRRSSGIKSPQGFPASKAAITVPANSSATLLLDQTFLTNAYPTIILSGGKNAGVSLSYAESLFTQFPDKGNRDEVGSKNFVGRKDSIIADGSDEQVFTPLSWRTYRYVQVNVTTKDQSLTIKDIYGTFTGYPFKMNANLQTGNDELNKIFEIGWRTARLCAVETYMDCPYYEQLQYIGDGRIQAMISLYNSGDDRLMRNALNLIDHSRQPEGITESRHPSYTPQFITTFSLWYIGMLHDYFKYGPDTTFIDGKIPGMRQVLSYFHNFQQADGSLKDLPYWLFTDWVTYKDWHSGVAPKGKNGNSAVLDLQLLWAYQLAADLESKKGIKEQAAIYNRYANQLKETIRKKYWDEKKHLFADRAEKDIFSQHANTLAILTGLLSGTEATAVAKHILADTTLAPASIYFKYYLHQALVKAGLGNDYRDWLNIWRENIKMGLTTWGESPEISSTRSDCHAWGSSPNIEFFRTLLGIDSDAPGFSKVKIEPHLGDIENIGGEMPHPQGKVAVKYSHANGNWSMNISLPAGVSGSFVWKGKTYPLKGGANSLKLK
jgi:hypothetical protein